MVLWRLVPPEQLLLAAQNHVRSSARKCITNKHVRTYVHLLLLLLCFLTNGIFALVALLPFKWSFRLNHVSLHNNDVSYQSKIIMYLYYILCTCYAVYTISLACTMPCFEF